jgi:hypothetical protein
MPPKPERSVEQTQEDDHERRPTEETGQDADANEPHGRAGEPAGDRVKHGQSSEAERDGQDDDHVDADKAHHSAEARGSRGQRQKHRKPPRNLKRSEGGRWPPVFYSETCTQGLGQTAVGSASSLSKRRR